MTRIARKPPAGKAKPARTKTGEISLIGAQSFADGPVHQEGLVGAVGGNLGGKLGHGVRLRRRQIRGRLGTLRGGAGRRWSGRTRGQLEREIEVSGCSGNLYIAPQVFEAKHVGFDNPRARGHSVQPERTFLVGESHQTSLALSRTDGSAGNRLASGLDGA